MKSSLGTLPAGGGGTLDLTIKQLGQIDFTDLASLKVTNHASVRDVLGTQLRLVAEYRLGEDSFFPKPKTVFFFFRTSGK